MIQSNRLFDLTLKGGMLFSVSCLHSPQVLGPQDERSPWRTQECPLELVLAGKGGLQVLHNVLE